MAPIVLHRTVAFTPDELFAVAADIEAYPEFLPHCVATRIRKRNNQVWLVDNVYRWGPVPIRFRTRATIDAPHRIDIRSTDSFLIDLALSWDFRAHGDGTDVTFEMHLELPGPNLGFLENSMRQEAQAIEQAFLKRAAQSSRVEK